MQRITIKVIKKILVYPIYFIYYFIVEVCIGAAMSDVCDRMLKWTDK